MMAEHTTKPTSTVNIELVFNKVDETLRLLSVK